MNPAIEYQSAGALKPEPKYVRVDSVEGELYRQRETLEAAEMQRDFSAAISRLPKDMAAVKSALDGLDKAIAAINVTVGQLGNFDRLGETMPLSDERLAELIRLRDAVWTTRNIDPFPRR